MPCFKPLQAFSSDRGDGKKSIFFSDTLARDFYQKVGCLNSFPDRISLPCGKCMGCRLENSRQWAVRCMHEAQMYEDNCFVTLTFNNDSLFDMCPNLSLDIRHVQLFMKRLRERFNDCKIRVFYCGEYGDKLGRPHYHLCLFNCDFADKVRWKKVNSFWHYNSDVLSSVWPYGHAVIAGLSFDSAAYVARYCTKKITGKDSVKHYQGRTPEFAHGSNRPGIGAPWVEKYGMSDVFLLDEVIVKGYKSKPPRYYDKLLERIDPDLLAFNKLSRQEKAEAREDFNDYRRLQDREKCQVARFKKLVRNLERSDYVA